MIDPPESTASPSPAARVIACRCCGLPHHPVNLGAGQKALCVRCGTLLARRGLFGRDAALAFTLSGIFLAIPATLLPFVTVDRLRAESVGHLYTGAQALWDAGMKLLGIWVLLCGVVAPVVLLGTLAGLLLPPRIGRSITGERFLWRMVRALEQWAMPEVYILAVLVALTKLGTLVNVTVGPGFWCYGATAALTLLAWRSLEYASPSETPAVPPAC